MDFNLNKLVNASLNWLFPPVCRICEKTIQHQALSENALYCNDCYLSLPFKSNDCPQCGRSLTLKAQSCGQCLRKPPPYDSCFSPFYYQPPISEQIHDFKYHDKPELAAFLATLLIEELTAYNIELPELLLPVPLHTSKLRERGYNQSWLLCQQLSKQLNIPTSHQYLSKIRATPAQMGLSLAQRKKNLANSFKLNRPIKAQHIAIIDDVITTGTTITRLSLILRQQGIKKIQVWSLSKTL